MSIEEAIELLEKSIREGHRIIDEHSLLTDERGYKEFEDAIKAREAILAFLKTHPEIQQNEPLTFEEVKNMIWHPVYYAECKQWVLANWITLEAIKGGAKFYRRPPKEET